MANSANAIVVMMAIRLTPYTLHPTLTLYTLHPTPKNLYPTFYTLHPTPGTLHPTPYTLHPTPYTLRPKPYTLHPTYPRDSSHADTSSDDEKAERGLALGSARQASRKGGPCENPCSRNGCAQGTVVLSV